MKINNQQKLNLQISVMAYPKHLSFRRKPESSIHEFLDPGFRRGDDTLPSQLPLQRDNKKKQHGFTLIELIIVVVLLGIVGAMGASFISEAFKGFFDTDVRMEMYEEGKSALVRMEREIHIALPNAVDVSPAGDTISFGVINEKDMAGIFGKYIESYPSNETFITDQKAELLLQGTPLISIYNTTWDDFANGSRIYKVDSVAWENPTQMKISLDPARKIGPASPYGRYYVVRPQAVRFSLVGTTMSRTTATVNAGSNLGAFGNSQDLARDIHLIPGLNLFTYDPGTSTRNSVVSIHFAINRNNETVNFHKEVQIRNVP